MNDDLLRFWRPSVRHAAGSGDPRTARHALVAALAVLSSSVALIRGFVYCITLLCWLVWNLPVQALAEAPEPAIVRQVPEEFQKAGVCARCHVVSVLEWGVSGHLAADTTCQNCHGPSRAHVANERNEIKPDRLPHGKAIAKQLCVTCHDTGCPETLQVESCQKCHHVHALIDLAKPPASKDQRFERLVERWKQFQQRMAAGEEQIRQQQWKAAQASFREALALTPGHRVARVRLEMCTRRLAPVVPGFQPVGDDFDPATGLPGRVRVEQLDATMVLLPPGEFDMGADALAGSRPVHTVRLDSFYLGQHEVTQAQWRRIMGSNPSVHQGEGFVSADRMPVERVSWDDCQEFLQRLNGRVPGAGFRMPTEAEWEYAGRTGVSESGPAPKRRDLALDEIAWYRLNSRRDTDADQAFAQVEAYAPRPVGTRQANSRGLYDMQGNVSEWCSSLFQPYIYSPTDGRESMTSRGLRVLRGGGFADSAAALDPAMRHAERAHRRLRWNGLRLARSVPPVKTAQGKE